MIVLEDTLMSSLIADQYFCCDLAACKGACCVEGDRGAPLEQEELAVLEAIFLKIKPYLTDKGTKAIEHYGLYVKENNGQAYTPLVEGRECAYAVCTIDERWECGIEAAFHKGNITFQKPISCHLYPIYVGNYRFYKAVNYDKWNICQPGCDSGKQFGIHLYQFLKEPLIRKFGKDWYAKLVDQIQKNNAAEW